MLRMFERIVIQVTSTLNLRRKILLLYGIIVIVPTIIISIIAVNYSLQIVRDNYMVTIQEAVKQTSQNIQYRKQSYDLLIVRTATDGELIARLSREHKDMFDQHATVEYVDRSFATTSKHLTGIRSFRIYHNNPTLVQDGSLLWKPEDRPFAGRSESMWYEEVLQAEDSPLWVNVPLSEKWMLVSHKVIASNGEGIGAIFMELNYEEVFGTLLNRPFNGMGELYILDHSQHVIASSDNSQIGLVNEYFTNMQAHTGSESTESFMDNGKQYYVQEIGAGWRVIGAIQLNQLERQSKWVVYFIVICLAFFLFLSTSMVLIVMKNIVFRIRKLGNRMNDIGQGEFSVSVRSREKDELGELELLFNSMSKKLSKLVHDITQSKLKEREQSFRALQAQINPHFIYNSLSLIRWRAMDLDDQVQIRAIDALTTFYRLALDNAINVTRIEHELQHVEAYLEIQQLRYPNMVTIEWNVDEEALPYYTIKLLLQPIVENCYIHGAITSKLDAKLRVSIKRQEQHIIMQVYDEGIGISAEKLAVLNEGKRTGSGNGFGLSNIRERLMLYFGEEGMFNISSEQGCWTLVEIRIPVCAHPPELKKEA